MATVRTLGIVIAGGLGVRLGHGAPKALVPVAGKTLLDRALRLLESCCDDVVVAAPSGRALPIAGRSRVDDVPGAAGPLAGLVAGLAARPFERAIVVGVDFPLMRAPTLEALVARLERDRVVVVIPAPGGVPQPLAAAYGSDALRPLAESLAAGERSITAAVLALGHTLVGDAELASMGGGLEDFFNLNTPEDLLEAERRLAARHTVSGPR